MKAENNDGNESDKAPGQNKSTNIIVNGTPKVWHEKEICYKDVVLLAFPDAKFEAKNEYTVSYEKANGNKTGTLVEGGKCVNVKEEMEFDVDPTNRS